MKYAVTIRISESTVAVSHIARLFAAIVVPAPNTGTGEPQRPSSEGAVPTSSTESYPGNEEAA